MVGDVFVLALQQKWMGQILYNTFAYRVTEQTGDVDLPAALSAGFIEAFKTNYENACATGWQADYVRIQKVLPLPIGPGRDFEAGWTGTRSGAPMPTEVAAVVKKLTEFGGKAGRGRIYVPGALSSDLDPANGRWTSGYQDKLSDIGASLTQFISVEFQANFEPVLFSHTTLLAKPLTSFGVNNVPRVQRRRQPGRGQ